MASSLSDLIDRSEGKRDRGQIRHRFRKIAGLSEEKDGGYGPISAFPQLISLKFGRLPVDIDSCFTRIPSGSEERYPALRPRHIVSVPAREMTTVFLLVVFLYFLMSLLWNRTYCEPASAFWLQSPWPLLWFLVFALLLMFHWIVLSWGAALLQGTVRWTDQSILTSLLVGLAVVGVSLLELWRHTTHEYLYLTGVRFEYIETRVLPEGVSFGPYGYNFEFWERECVDDPTYGYPQYEPVYQPWPAEETDRKPTFWSR